MKNLIFGPILARLAQTWDPEFFSWLLPLLVVRHFSRLSYYAILRKLTNQTSENGEKTILELILAHMAKIWIPYFLWILPRLVSRHYSKLSSYLIQKKTNKQNLTKW